MDELVPTKDQERRMLTPLIRRLARLDDDHLPDLKTLLNEAIKACGGPPLEDMLASEWQPIETAPRDEFVIVMSLNEDGQPAHVQQGRFFTAIGQWVMTFGNSRTPDPTHWMPLPEPPA